jgi:hypothetical protein
MADSLAWSREKAFGEYTAKLGCKVKRSGEVQRRNMVVGQDLENKGPQKVIKYSFGWLP